MSSNKPASAGFFQTVAAARYAEILNTGKTIAWDEMRRYLKARLAGQPAQRPVARKIFDHGN